MELLLARIGIGADNDTGSSVGSQGNLASPDAPKSTLDRQTKYKRKNPMTKTFHGKVNGQSIEIDGDLDIADGEEVEVVVRRTQTSSSWGDGIRRSAGAAAGMPEFDDVFAQIEKERKAAQFRETDE